jgi:hypothetical protein
MRPAKGSDPFFNGLLGQLDEFRDCFGQSGHAFELDGAPSQCCWAVALNLAPNGLWDLDEREIAQQV